MLVLVIYDIHTGTPSGNQRLHKIAKLCESIGTRVQNSVFECLLDAAQFRKLKQSLLSMIDPSMDRLRFYNLGNTYNNRIESVGVPSTDYYEDPIIL